MGAKMGRLGRLLGSQDGAKFAGKAMHVHVGVCACACRCVCPPRGARKHPQRCQKAPPEAPKRQLRGVFGHLGGRFGTRRRKIKKYYEN